MIIFHSIKELQGKVRLQKKSGKSLGFVPTMGALHDGHLSLIEHAKQECDLVIVSIFVNPKQFNNSLDLSKYPRTIEKDIALLEAINCDYLFTPNEKEIYPESESEQDVYDFGILSSSLEAKHRPGHFDGVAKVVRRLFEIVKADKAYFGEKDYQQLAIIRSLCKSLKSPPEIVGCPIIRESSGLAMSSRNMLLSEKEVEEATILSRVLSGVSDLVLDMNPGDVCESCTSTIEQNSSLKVEYFEIVDAHTFEEIISWEDSKEIIALVAAFIGKVRLIDNMQIDSELANRNLNLEGESSQVKIV